MRTLIALTLTALVALVAAPTAQADVGATTGPCLIDGEVQVHCFYPDHKYCLVRVNMGWINGEVCPGG